MPITLVYAHVGTPVAPHDIWHAWSIEPLVIGTLSIGALAYARGVAALRLRAGRERGLATWRARCFACASLAIALALVSPLDALGEALFAGHMVQHLLLTMVAAPLLVLSDPATTMVRALPSRARRGVARAWRRASVLRRVCGALVRPELAWTLHAVTLTAWHLPTPYEAAVHGDAVHALEHASFVVTAVLFWWPVAAPRPRARLHFGAALLYLFSATVASALFGALITLARVPWYRVHARSAIAWGLTPLEDQQLAGLIMWVPAGLVYVGAALVLCVIHLRSDQLAIAA